MQSKKKLIKIFIIMTLILSIIIVIFLADRKEIDTKEFKNYTLTYYDMMEPGSKSVIKINNNMVEITTTRFCSALDCESTTENQMFVYSDENTKKLITFINDNFSGDAVELYPNNLTDRQEEIIQGILLGEYFFEISVEEYKYRAGYLDDDSQSYSIFFKEDSSIVVKKIKTNDKDSIEKIDTYSLNFSASNLKILNDYIEKKAKEEDSTTLQIDSSLNKKEKNILYSITKNDEKYLNNINVEPKLVYTISYNGINCPTPTLYLYDNNTYEYYYMLSTSSNNIVPKIGTYNYDVEKIIKNIYKYEENKIGPYYIKDSTGKEYTTYNTNIELQELLKLLDIKLERCLE